MKAFTLVELLLVVLLTGLLLSAMVASFGSFRQHSSLDNGLTNLHTLTIYSRATAMNTGRKVRIEFPEGSPIVVTTERDPINQPDQFTAVVETSGWLESINQSLVVFSRTGSTDAQPTAQLICYPDGSVEQSEPLTAQSKDDQDARRIDVKFPHAVIPPSSLVD